MAEDVKTGNDGTKESPTREEEKAPWERLSLTMDKRMDLAVAVFVVLLGVFICVEARGIRPGSIADPIGSNGIASGSGIFLILAGMVTMVLRLWNWSKLPGHFVPDEGDLDEKGYPVSAVRAFGIISLSVLWLWLLKPLGFLIVTPSYLFASAWVMGERKWGQIIAFSMIYSVSIWVIFGPLLGVRLPLGPLTHVARSFGLIY